jgi:hypothetical protein
MKATINVPDGLYREVKARSALEGRSVRDVTVLLFERWLAESPSAVARTGAQRSKAADTWVRTWTSIGGRISESANEGSSTREILIADRER